MAPEVIMAGPDSNTPSSHKVERTHPHPHSLTHTHTHTHTQVDVWSLGVILLELVMVCKSLLSCMQLHVGHMTLCPTPLGDATVP